jgi:hypothetical protein
MNSVPRIVVKWVKSVGTNTVTGTSMYTDTETVIYTQGHHQCQWSGSSGSFDSTSSLVPQVFGGGPTGVDTNT